jgi:hypothetical protein
MRLQTLMYGQIKAHADEFLEFTASSAMTFHLVAIGCGLAILTRADRANVS